MQHQVEGRVRAGLRVSVVVASGLLAGCALGQAIFPRPSDYPHFRGALAVPGSFFSLDWEGNPSSGGALTLSTPVGIVLAPREFLFGVASLSKDRNFRMITGEHGDNDVNGDAWGLVGLEYKGVRFSIGGRWLSAVGENVGTVHVQVLDRDDWKASVGTLDVGGSGAAFGNEDTRTLYAVVTTRLGPAYLSAGWGTLRYKRGFGAISWEALTGATLFVEHDGFGFNYGIGIEMDGHWHLLIGMLRDRNAVIGTAFRL
ncbi:MAG: hypothetical protein KatS3mg015_1411 [Fimbriimonadales bacterium]|nr:MAG: hypothetical protein KatS3mg015_1411 [Fimbriimonadales bacterium]